MSYYNVDTVTFTPVYLDITANVTSSDGFGTASVTTDDTYLKAAATEPVSFSVTNITAGYEITTSARSMPWATPSCSPTRPAATASPCRALLRPLT